MIMALIHYSAYSSGNKANFRTTIVFSGENVFAIEKRWKKIEEKIRNDYLTIWRENDEKRRKYYKEAEQLFNRIKQSKPFYRFWYNSDEKELLYKAREFETKSEELRKQNIKIMIDMNEVDEYQLKERFLKENGFVLKTIENSGPSSDPTITETWILE